MKTRYSKPFETVELEIPYDTGLDPFSGMFEYLLSKDIITRNGNKYVYIDMDGNEHKYYEKEYKKNTNNIYELILSEWNKERDQRDQDESLLENIEEQE
jgi:hypothetical protein